MKIELRTARNDEYGRPQQWGDVIEVSDADGQRMIAADQAVEVAMRDNRGEQAVAVRKIKTR